MKSYDELKAEMETIQQQITAGMLKGALAEGRKKK